MRKSTKSISKLKKEADKWFSRYIRYRDKGQCFTCPKKDNPKYMQCSHFIPRQYLATRYDEINCACACYACNMLYGGQIATFGLKLQAKFGDGIVKELEAKKWKPFKVDSSWYEEIISKYKTLVEEYEKER